MTLEERIAKIVAIDCLTPIERAAMITALPALKVREIRVAVMAAVEAKRAREGDHGRFIAA
jgi:hypothetical protein